MADTVVLTHSGEFWFAMNLVAEYYYGAWGKGAGTASKADGHLFDEEPARHVCYLSLPNENTIQYVWELVSGSDMTVTEAGIFSTFTGYTLIFHATFDGIPLLVGDSIEFTLTQEIT